MSLALSTVTTDDSLALGRLGDAARCEIMAWMPQMERIAKAGAKSRMAVYRSIAEEMGVSESNVRGRYAAYKKQGFVALAHKQKMGVVRALPPAFISHWKTLLVAHQRDTSGQAARRCLIAQWKGWKAGNEEMAVPGYEECPPASLTGYPEGWSYANLMLHKPTKYEEALRRQGTKRASEFTPSIRTSRVGLLPGQIVVSDDEMPDVYTLFASQAKGRIRPHAFHNYDLSSGAFIQSGFRPILTREDGTKSQLTQEDFLFFQVAYLTNIGYRPDTGTTLIVEHGTAAISEEFETAISRATDCKVIIDRSGKFGGAERGLLLGSKGSGNFRYKPIEGMFNLMRNESCAAPGAVGRNRDMAPEESYGLEKQSEVYMELVHALPAEDVALLRTPGNIMHWSVAIPWLMRVIKRINERSEHRLQGWADMGRIITEISIDRQNWMPSTIVNQMPEQARNALLAVAGLPGYSRPRRLSPAEVWNNGRGHGLRKVPAWLWPVLIPSKYAREIVVTQQLEIVLQDQAVSEDPLIFRGVVTNENGYEIALKRGATYLGYYTPFSAGAMQICEASGVRRGAWIGQSERVIIDVRTNYDAVLRQMQDAQAAMLPELAEIKARQSGLILQRQTGEMVNRSVLERGGLLNNSRKAGALKPAKVKARAAAVTAEEGLSDALTSF